MNDTHRCAITGCGAMAFHVAKLVDNGERVISRDVTLEEVVAELAKGHTVPLCGRDQKRVVELANRLAA